MKPFPPVAAFHHRFTGREGFEVAFIAATAGGHRVEGHTCAVEDGVAWNVGYVIELDGDCRTRRATVTNLSIAGGRATVLESHGDGRWTVDGAPMPSLDGTYDVDLESSSLTNAFPIRRLSLPVGASAQAPAAYVRAADLAVERLEQTYRRLEDDGARERYHYASPRFGYEGELVYDENGIVLEYPGIATRAL